MPSHAALFKSAAAPFAIGTAVTIGTSTIQDAPKLNQSAHIFTAADGNIIAVYFDGTNGGYRIKASGTWGSFTAFTGGVVTGNSTVCTRNGDNIYCLQGNSAASGSNMQVRKLAYASGAITQTSQAFGLTDNNTNQPLSIYYDTTNGIVHCLGYVKGTLGPNDDIDIGAYNGTTITTTAIAPIIATPTGTVSTNVSQLVGDGTSTFYFVNTVGASTAITSTKYVSGAASYTTTTAETGLPTAAANITSLGAVYDGTNILILVNENNAKMRLTTRTAVNTYSAYSDIATATLGASAAPALFRKGTAASSDLVLFFRNNTTQANGEIYYLRRRSGAWDTSPGTLMVGGATTGWSNVSAATSDLNVLGTARVLYMTGTVNPFTATENNLSGL